MAAPSLVVAPDELVVAPSPVASIVGTELDAPDMPKCAGGFTMEELIAKRIEELRKLLDEQIISGKPITKAGIATYLCASTQNGHCDPEAELNCDDGYVCDAQAKVCLDPSQAQARPNLSTMTWNGREIIGTAHALATLKKKLDVLVDVQEPSTPPKPPTPKVPTPKVPTPKPSTPKVPTPKPSTPKVPTPKPSTPKPSTPKVPTPKPAEGTSIPDPAALLRQIQEDGSIDDLDNLTETQNSILRCMGLLA